MIDIYKYKILYLYSNILIAKQNCNHLNNVVAVTLEKL